MQALARRNGESREVLATQELLGDGALLFERSDQAQRLVALGFDPREGFPEQVGILDRSFGQRAVQALDFAFRDRERLAQLLRLRRIVMRAVFGAGDQSREQDFQPFRREYLLLDLAKNKIVEVGHRNAPPPASRLTFVHGVVARVIAVASAFAGAQRHTAPAGGALGDPRQQSRSVKDARRHPCWPPRLKRALHSLENMRLDNDGRLEFNPLAAFLALAGAPFLAIEVVASGISFACQDFMDAGRSELAAAMGDVLPVEFMRDNAHAVPGAVHIEDHAHDSGFRRLDRELLLDGIGAGFHHDRLVAKGRLGAVPKSLPCILFHGAQDVLGVLTALVLIEHRAELAEHLPARIVGHGLRDRDQGDVVLFQRAAVQLELKRIPEEARKAVNQHHVEGAVGPRRIVHHALELRALVIRGRSARLDIFGDDLPALVLRPALQLIALVGDGQVFLGLPRG